MIGRRYPMDRVRSHLARLATPFPITSALPVATAMMTTDTTPRVAARTVLTRSDAVARPGLGGRRRQGGTIEPDMATMLAFVFTDAEVVAPDVLDTALRRVVDRTFNSLSVDTDTSTSDTAAVLASGAAGAGRRHPEQVLGEVCLDLTRQLAADGEGPRPRSWSRSRCPRRRPGQAGRQAIVNSPLVKTAGARRGPQLGSGGDGDRKCSDDTDIDQDRCGSASATAGLPDRSWPGRARRSETT